MIRFLLFLLNKTGYETCLSCSTLRQERDYLREENKRLTDTILSIVKPKAVEAPPYEVSAVKDSILPFSRRREALEEAERLKARTLRESPHVARSDETIARLEKETGISQEA